MLRSRVIPCLLVHNKGLVKTVKFKSPKYVGDPINAVKIFNEKEVDELIVLDIDATVNGVEPNYQMIQYLANESRERASSGAGRGGSGRAGRVGRGGERRSRRTRGTGNTAQGAGGGRGGASGSGRAGRARAGRQRDPRRQHLTLASRVCVCAVAKVGDQFVFWVRYRYTVGRPYNYVNMTHSKTNVRSCRLIRSPCNLL